MYLIKNNSIEAAYLLVHLAAILMIYLSAAEVFVVCEILIEKSLEIFKSKHADSLRWHIPVDQKSYTKTIQTFMEAYL